MESERRLAGQAPTIEQRYYLVSLDGGIQRFAQAVRSHWGIENQLHWVSDVAFGEDACRIRKDHAPENLALIRHVALNFLRQETSAKGGIKAKRLRARWDNDYLSLILSSHSSMRLPWEQFIDIEVSFLSLNNYHSLADQCRTDVRERKGFKPQD